MKSHVSINAILYKIAGEAKSVNDLPGGYRFVGHGKHVNPNGNYENAKIVTLYQTSKGFLIIK